MDRNTAFLLSEGYRLARYFNPNCTDVARAVGKDIIVISDANGNRQEVVVTSTRITLIGQEITGGPLGDDYGIVCGDDIRNSRVSYTLGGGRMEPFALDYRVEGDEDAEESVMDCLLREVGAELGLAPNPNEVILVGVREITETNSRELKRIDGRICVDAYFAGIVNERLGVFRARDGEVGDRRVLSPEVLLHKLPRGEKNPLPETQRLAVATTIITLWDLYGKTLPKPITALIERTMPLARTAYKDNFWVENFIPVIQRQ